MLFESEGTSMTEFVRDERLKRARSILLSPGAVRRRIAEIAYEVGFNESPISIGVSVAASAIRRAKSANWAYRTIPNDRHP